MFCIGALGEFALGEFPFSYAASAQAGSFSHTYNSVSLSIGAPAFTSTFSHSYNSATIDIVIPTSTVTFAHTYNSITTSWPHNPGVGAATFAHTYVSITYSWPHSPGMVSTEFFHVYMPASITSSITESRRPSVLIRPVNRQVVDPNTGVVRQEWEVYFRRIEEALNTMANQIAQG